MFFTSLFTNKSNLTKVKNLSLTLTESGFFNQPILLKSLIFSDQNEY